MRAACRIRTATARERLRPPRMSLAALTHSELGTRPSDHWSQLPTPADAAPALAAPSGTRPPSGHGLPSRADPPTSPSPAAVGEGRGEGPESRPAVVAGAPSLSGAMFVRKSAEGDAEGFARKNRLVEQGFRLVRAPVAATHRGRWSPLAAPANAAAHEVATDAGPCARDIFFCTRNARERTCTRR
jgi:hypothetical protein